MYLKKENNSTKHIIQFNTFNIIMNLSYKEELSLCLSS